jgi:hypothetical protein
MKLVTLSRTTWDSSSRAIKNHLNCQKRKACQRKELDLDQKKEIAVLISQWRTQVLNT